MCGIFGLITKPETEFPQRNIANTLKNIALLSESRGKDSAGIAFRLNTLNSIDVIKGDIPIKNLVSSREFNSSLQKCIKPDELKSGFAAFGHARLVTNGSQLQEENNQPVVKSNLLTIHNGIITNIDELWKNQPDLHRKYHIDTEYIPTKLRYELDKNDDLIKSLNNTLEDIEGTYSLAMMFNDLNQFILCTNNGSLYYLTDKKTFIVFASEEYFLEKLKKTKAFKAFNPIQLFVNQIISDTGLIIDMNEFKLKPFSLFDKNDSYKVSVSDSILQTNKFLIDNIDAKYEVVIDPSVYINRSEERHLTGLLENNIDAIRNLKRCTKCLLPETFPFIEYDKSGVCNYCKNYKLKNQTKPIDELKALVEPYKRKNNKPDCIVPFSGGRDSTYTLHIVKEILGLNPIAYTYDWGMVTDLARRNAARVCGKLGIENIIVAADIRMKRNNINKNVSAWLKNPQLGMVPLFMAGDKYFFYYSNKILNQNNLELSIWGSNPLENTDFKLGFTGIKPNFNKKRIDYLKLSNKLKLAKFFSLNYLQNQSYFNSSLYDTFGSFLSRYLIKRYGYFQLFDYIKWDEQEIENLIINVYNWEKSIDTKSTWRIGDGTAAFYNYIYYTVAGFSEFDTFRSNQIREGQLTREKGLKLVEEENRPRYENLRWYIEIIGLDFKSTIERINQIAKLYKQLL